MTPQLENINCPICAAPAIKLAILDPHTSTPFVCPKCSQGFQIAGTPDQWNKVDKKPLVDNREGRGHMCPRCLGDCSTEDDKLTWRCDDAACNCLYYFMAVPIEDQH